MLSSIQQSNQNQNPSRNEGGDIFFVNCGRTDDGRRTMAWTDGGCRAMAFSSSGLRPDELINNVVNNLFTPGKLANKQISFVLWRYIHLKL